MNNVWKNSRDKARLVSTMLRIKFVFLPIPGIICNIIFDPLIFCLISDDVFVKTGLPPEFQSQPVAMPGDRRFVRT